MSATSLFGLAADHPLDAARLETWLGRVAPQLGDGGVELSKLTGGSSGAVFKVSRGAGVAVLRLPVWPLRDDSHAGAA